jgi:hypothetical protein
VQPSRGRRGDGLKDKLEEKEVECKGLRKEVVSAHGGFGFGASSGMSMRCCLVPTFEFLIAKHLVASTCSNSGCQRVLSWGLKSGEIDGSALLPELSSSSALQSQRIVVSHLRFFQTLQFIRSLSCGLKSREFDSSGLLTQLSYSSAIGNSSTAHNLLFYTFNYSQVLHFLQSF